MVRSNRLFAAVLLLAAGCSPEAAPRVRITVKGSDTLVQVATGWAELYRGRGAGVDVSASGGGSGTGIAGLIDGTVDVATSSREIKPAERDQIRAKRGAEVHEHVVGLDALAIFVHPQNPIDRISLEQLQQIWAEDGTTTDWSTLDPRLAGEIVLIGRQNSSGTYDYFREVVCGVTPAGVHREFRGGVSELNGSSEVVEKIAKAEQALGYTGMGYHSPHVKWLAVSRTSDGPAVAPSIASATDGTYPIARKLFVYTVGEPTPELQTFLEWTMGPEGQAIVGQEGYVPRIVPQEATVATTDELQ